MPTGPPNSTTTEDGRRTYTHPVTEEVFTSITTALEPISKFGLVMWSGQLAARAALLELPKLIQATATRPCGRSTNQCKHDWRVRCINCRCTRCEDCLYRYLSTRHSIESTRRSNEGTAAHAWVNWWVRNGEYLPAETFCNDQNQVDPQKLTPYLGRFKHLVEAYGLTQGSFLMSEGTVLNRELMAAGTTDGIVRVVSGASAKATELCRRLGFEDYADVMYDVKTREKTKEDSGGRVVFYDDNPLQLAGYDMCDTVMLKNGDEHPRPPVDAHAIIQLRPDGYEFRPARIEDRERDAFITALYLFRWCQTRGTKQMAIKQYPLPARDAVLRRHDTPTSQPGPTPPIPDPTGPPSPTRSDSPTHPEPGQTIPTTPTSPTLPTPTRRTGAARTRPAVTVPPHQQKLRDSVLGQPGRDDGGLFADPLAEEIPF